MKYIETFIISGVLIHLVLIKIASFIMGVRTKKLWIIISIFIDIIYMILYVYYPYKIETYQYAFIVIISFLPFISKNIREMMSLSFIYFLGNFALGGISEILYYSNFYSFYFVFIVLFVLYISSVLYKLYRSFHINVKNLNYEILIIDKDKTYNLIGFCDTGNFLCDDNFIPIVFINEKYDIGSYLKSQDIQSIGNKASFPLYLVDSFCVKVHEKYIKKDVLIARGKINYDVMFGTNILGG